MSSLTPGSTIDLDATFGILRAAGPRKALLGFFVVGSLLASPGLLLTVWGFHLGAEFGVLGTYFLAMGLGVLLSIQLSHLLLARGVAFCLVTSCVVATIDYLCLSQATPPVAHLWRILGLLVLGACTGLLLAALLESIAPLYRHNARATLNLAALLFSLGSLFSGILVSFALEGYTAAAVLFWLAVVPALSLRLFIPMDLPSFGARPLNQLQQLVETLRTPGTVMFALLLFLQLGNEFCLSAWLPMFLIQRVGASPAVACLMLSLLFGTVMLGRVFTQWFLARSSIAWLLLVHPFATFFGCVFLTTTENRLGATAGILLIGLSFAIVVPLVADRFGHRFAAYHAGFYHGLFSLALTCGLFMPCLLGYMATFTGLRVLMIVPLFGSVAVFLLICLILLEVRLLSGLRPRL